MKVEKDANEAYKKAAPILAAATEAVNCINKGHIGEMKNLSNPPATVKFIMRLCLILFKTKFGAKDDDMKVFKKGAT